MEIFSICGRVAALGYTYFRVLCVCLSTFLASVLVRVLHPCVAHELWKLLRGCNCCVLTWWTHLTDGMLFVCLCTLLLWSGCGKHLTGSSVWMKVECIPRAICSCTCVWKLEREKHLRITQSGIAHHKHVLYSMWNVHSQNSSWNQSLPCLALKLHFWLSFCCLSGCRSGRPRNRKSAYQRQRETFSCCVWLAPFYYRLARNDSHLRFCCERGHSTKGINQDHLRAEGFCYLSMARSTRKTYLSGSFPSIAPRTDLISISWVEGFGYRSIRRANETYIYTYQRCL